MRRGRDARRVNQAPKGSQWAIEATAHRNAVL